LNNCAANWPNCELVAIGLNSSQESEQCSAVEVAQVEEGAGSKSAGKIDT